LLMNTVMFQWVCTIKYVMQLSDCGSRMWLREKLEYDVSMEKIRVEMWAGEAILCIQPLDHQMPSFLDILTCRSTSQPFSNVPRPSPLQWLYPFLTICVFSCYLIMLLGSTSTCHLAPLIHGISGIKDRISRWRTFLWC